MLRVPTCAHGKRGRARRGGELWSRLILTADDLGVVWVSSILLSALMGRVSILQEMDVFS